MKTKKLDKVRFIECCLCGHDVSTHSFEAVDEHGNKMIGFCCGECSQLDDADVWELRLIGRDLQNE